MLNFAARSINYNSRALFLRYHPCRPLSQLKEPKEEGVVIYNHSQHMTIRIMLGVAIVNFYAWSGHLFNNYFYQGQSVAGIDLSGGDPTIGYVGTAASFGLAYFTRYFANHAVYSVSLTKDERKLHFQVHNFFGNPGKIIEVDVWKAKFKTPLKSTGVKSVLLSSSYIPIQINGLNSYLLVEKEGFGDLDSPVVRSLSDGNALHLDSKTKEDRKEWNKRSYRRNDKE